MDNKKLEFTNIDEYISLQDDNIKEITLKSGDTLILRAPIEEDAKNMIDYLNIVGGESDNLLFGKDEFRLSVEQEVEYIKKVHQDPKYAYAHMEL